MEIILDSGAATNPPLSNGERVAAWKKRHKPKRKVAEVPQGLASIFENKLKLENKAYQSWLIEKIKEYVNS